MNAAELKRKLITLLADDFSLSIAGIDEHASVFDQLAIDSMLLVGIISRIEQEFGVELPLSLMDNPTLGNLVKLIEDNAHCN